MHRPLSPWIEIPGDNDGIQQASGELIAWSKTRAIWRFGFLPDSRLARAFNCSVPEFRWILADWAGMELGRYNGFSIDLPPRFRRIIRSRETRRPRTP